jgi:hypothetical protein
MEIHMVPKELYYHEVAYVRKLEEALQRAFDFLQDKSFTPDSLTHECTKVVEQIEDALGRK